MATPSYTPLPPSPELRPNGSHLSSDMDPFSLGGINLSGTGGIVGGDSSSPSRLRSIARYQAFSPQALACSDPILPSSFSGSSNTIYAEDSENNIGAGRSFLQTSSASARRQQRSPHSASLGAIAGAQGVAVFRISKPHEPLLMLNHATSNHANSGSSHGVHGNLRKITNSPRNQQHQQHQSQGGGGRPVTALAFQPDATRSLYLAAARGSGVLVWDVSGHSISPLLGRLAMDASVGGGGTGHIYSSGSDFAVTSLSWKASAERDGAPLLATTTNYSACIWDLRSPVATAKPSVRFGVKTKKSNSNNNGGSSRSAVSPYVQIACSRSNECATLDAAGTVRVFDIRMTDQTRYSVNSLATFAAFAHRGVGISYIHAHQAGASAGRSTNWVTWGLDSPDIDAVVKVWSSSGNVEADPNVKSDNSTQKTEDTYWYMDGSPGRISGVSPYKLIAQCSPPYHLACSRVCPDPVENSIMTIGILDDNMGNTSKRGHDGWRAELWKIRAPTAVELDANDGTFGMERIVSFNGGAVHDACIESVLGRNTRIGQLQAAELAITSSTAASLQNFEGGDDRIQDSSQPELELALCCLSDKGYVTTHLIPEAMPRKVLSKLGQTSPQLFSNGNRTKVFNDDREGAADAALLWGTQGDRPTRVGIETRTIVERVRTQYQSSPVKENINQGAAPKQPKQRNSDGGMLFEMDVPAVAYGTAERMPGVQVGGPIDLTSPKAVATAAMVEETNNAAAHVRDVATMAERMDNIETERIPCPRICSAVFGPGVGGLAIFKNGDVKKMWTWYDRASSSRLSGIPSSISAPEMAFSDPGSSKGLGSAGNHESELKTSNPRDYPRSMKDLMDMTEAASEAQWGGEVNESGAADSQDEQEQSSNDNFFEYMSTGSISSDSDDNEPIEFDSGKGSSRYENYFGNFRRPLAVPGGNTKQSEGDEQKPQVEQTESPGTSKLPVVGPSSDTLAPTVHVTHDFDKLALNNQSAELAKDWELGQWQTEEEVRVRLSPGMQAYLEPTRHLGTLQEDSGMFDPPTSPTIQRGLPTGLPSYRRLTETPPKNNVISRSKSDSIILPVAPALQNAQIENEHGVHGGEYAVRPNMQESMVFLRKLFSHQQQEGNAFPSLLSPPDSPAVFQKNRKSLPNIAVLEQLRRQGEVNTRQPSAEVSAPDEKRARAQPGVYALATDAFGVHEDDRKLSQVKNLCMHNAAVCEKYGESGKQKVWLLLEQMVDRRLNEMPDAFNGWGGKGGGALGVDLVKNIMKYYETLGDVQMLATIVCVLSGGRPRNQEDDQLDLLPTDEKYDTYIRRYSDLLFGWSLLVKRAELNKHLAQRVQENEGNNIVSDTPASRLRAPGIELVFTCPRCGEDAANICRTCQDFAFRCSVCENGVRGLFMVCDSCGHGGHAGHINSWFAKHSECPSGCGCLCTFSSRAGPSPVQNDTARVPAFIIEPLGD